MTIPTRRRFRVVMDFLLRLESQGGSRRPKTHDSLRQTNGSERQFQMPILQQESVARKLAYRCQSSDRRFGLPHGVCTDRALSRWRPGNRLYLTVAPVRSHRDTSPKLPARRLDFITLPLPKKDIQPPFQKHPSKFHNRFR